jgi:hypothetical protein
VEKQIAGKDWLEGFRRRHPELAIRKPEATSLARAQAFNKPQVAKFFEVLQHTIESNKINPLRIYNMDESGLTTVVNPESYCLEGKRIKSVLLQTREEESTVWSFFACHLLKRSSLLQLFSLGSDNALMR